MTDKEKKSNVKHSENETKKSATANSVSDTSKTAAKTPKTSNAKTQTSKPSRAKSASEKVPADVKSAEAAAPKSESLPKTKKSVSARSKSVADNLHDNTKTDSASRADSARQGKRIAEMTVEEFVKTETFRICAIIMLLVLTFSLCLGLALGLKSCNDSLDIPFVNAYKSATKVGYSSEVLGTVERYKPVDGIRDGGLETGYPEYDHTLSLTTEQKNAILAENKKLCAKPTTNTGGLYDWMDKDGNLYVGTRSDYTVPDGGITQLYKHTGSVNLYMGNVADDEPAVIKRLTFRPRTYGSYYSVTGLYAPAGEVIKIQISESDMNATSGITVHIGQALYNGQANNIWSARNFNRMPVILNTMNITKDTAELEDGVYTAYVGSFLGGPIYIRSESSTFSVTISGGVNYAHFILGVTTKEEYETYAKSSAPYFDLEVWDSGVLHSGPMYYAKNFSYDDLYKAAILWEKISLVSSRVSNQGIVFLYDPFVAAGAAVAFPGRRSVNCPAGWMTSSLNYNSFVTSGAWGNMHEYHHNFQNYGVGYTGEVTNNALNLVSYSLFTKISSARQLSSYGGSGLSGWNCYTSATWALNRVNTGEINSTNGLAVYATLLHNLGQDAFIKSTGASGAAYFNKWAANTHLDFTYFASQITAYTGSVVTPAATDYPTFVPVSSVYQTGRTYNYVNDDGTVEKREISTMQPFVIPSGKSYIVDLREYHVNDDSQYEYGSIVVGNGFKATVKNVRADAINGKFEETETKGVYKFTPNEELNSGKIYVTVEITTEDGSHTYNGKPLDDVDLILEFQQSHESNKAILERTVYTFEEGENYTDAAEAYENNYRGAISAETVDNKNISQNSNTDVWLYGDSDANVNNPAYEGYVVNKNQIFEIKGKLYFPEAGMYRIYLRGRISCALYISRDNGKTYEKVAYIQEEKAPSTGSADFRLNDPNTYKDVYVNAEEWIYFKEVLITVPLSPKANTASYVGLGIGSWTTPMYTTVEKFYDADGNEVPAGDATAVTSRTHYYNERGQEVTAEEASNTTPVPPTSATYATAYRQSYEFTKQFESDYFYTREYDYDYTEYEFATSEEVVSHNYVAPPLNWGWGNYPLSNLTDGNNATFIHTKEGVSASKPLELVIDTGKAQVVNRMTIYSQYRPNGDWKVAKSFTLYGSLDGEEFFTVGEFTNVPRSGSTVTVNFDAAYLRYYKLVITESYSGEIIIGGIELLKAVEIKGGKQYSPDNDKFLCTGPWKAEQASSSFGHVYVGDKGAEMKFEFEGTRVGIISSKYYGKNFEVYVDGQLVESIALKKDDNDFAVCYLTSELAQGKHSVVVKCVGEANIDSVLIF
ncbi:MAG: M60 family metallopeptidase [Corallococcus sp.]|nr:M60 family metallopeptidase [Corallococcus sp.]MCM1360009.1 M60 family metallopeptidase [Corallococcus sp.]MCM1395566.1 M60 family metallopeptidase [Corallococcus sp.]